MMFVAPSERRCRACDETCIMCFSQSRSGNASYLVRSRDTATRRVFVGVAEVRLHRAAASRSEQ